MKKHLGFALNLFAIVLFVPGILMPMFSLNMELMATIGGSGLTSPLVNKELSLMATINELFQDERIFVAALIFIFSICIPILKTGLIAFSYWHRNTQLEVKIVAFVGKIGKWSMADVFIVAIFLAVLSTNHGETTTNEKLTMFGFKIDLLISSETLSSVGLGFYYFTAYCLLSLLGTHLSHSSVNAIVKPKTQSIE